MNNPLTVVVPIFNAAGQTRRCLKALHRSMASCPDSVAVLLIDDASTDPEIAKILIQIQARLPGWVVKRSKMNRGFVGTANLGMQLAGTSDVLLLNSDTVPVGDWLERIRRCA
ncbi:MAG: glycosyltransferase family A protein, partial [Pseudomonadota bacterium]